MIWIKLDNVLCDGGIRANTLELEETARESINEGGCCVLLRDEF